MSTDHEDEIEYLPNSTGEDDDGLIEKESYRGESLGGASASVCAGFEPDRIRHLWYDPDLRMITMFAGALFLLVIGSIVLGNVLWAAGGGWGLRILAILFYVLGGALLLIDLVVVIFLVLMSNTIATYYKNTLLTPGVIVLEKPVAIVVLASLNNGSGREYYGLQRLNPGLLPYHPHDWGTRVPMVTAFYPGEGLDRWVAFTTKPISWGSGNRADLNRCFARLGTDDFERLDQCIARGLIPQDEDTLLLLDANDRLLQTLSIKEEKKRHERTEGSSV